MWNVITVVDILFELNGDAKNWKRSIVICIYFLNLPSYDVSIAMF